MKLVSLEKGPTLLAYTKYYDNYKHIVISKTGRIGCIVIILINIQANNF